MTTRLFQKPKLDSKEYLATLQKEILQATIDTEALKTDFWKQKLSIDRDLEAQKAKCRAELELLESELAIKRAERAELEKPYLDKRSELNEKEKTLIEREQVAARDVQNAFVKEREAEDKLVSLQDLADQLGETRVRQMVKEQNLQELEKIVHERENSHLIRVENARQELLSKIAAVNERERLLELRELNVESKTENLEKRENKLVKDTKVLEDRRQTLLRNINRGDYGRQRK